MLIGRRRRVGSVLDASVTCVEPRKLNCSLPSTEKLTTERGDSFLSSVICGTLFHDIIPCTGSPNSDLQDARPRFNHLVFPFRTSAGEFARLLIGHRHSLRRILVLSRCIVISANLGHPAILTPQSLVLLGLLGPNQNISVQIWKKHFDVYPR